MPFLRRHDQRRDCRGVRRHSAHGGARLDQGADAAPRRAGFVSDHAASPRRMTRERWSLLEPLIDAALDLAPDRRPAFYDEVTANDPELRAELERPRGRSGDGEDLFSSAAAERFARLLDGTRAPSLVTEVLPQLQVSLGSAYTL